jgi:hypothetical protein
MAGLTPIHMLHVTSCAFAFALACAPRLVPTFRRLACRLFVYVYVYVACNNPGDRAALDRRSTTCSLQPRTAFPLARTTRPSPSPFPSPYDPWRLTPTDRNVLMLLDSSLA